MPVRVPSLQLPLPRSEAARKTNRQLTVWASQMVSVVNSLGANPGLKASGNSGSGVTTLSFSGTDAAIDISATMHFVQGGVSLAAIKAPQGFTGVFFMIALNAFALAPGGNIVLPEAGVALAINEMLPMVFDGKNCFVAIEPPAAPSNLLNVKIITYADSPYTVTPEDEVIIGSAGTGADTIVNLPSAGGSGRPLDVKKLDANPYSIALTPAGTDTIDDAAGSYDILARYASYTVVDYSPGKWAIL
jgi:hypothetical protein